MFRNIDRWQESILRVKKSTGIECYRRVLGVCLIAMIACVFFGSEAFGATAGWWDELGFRSASGGGATWDLQQDNGEAELLLSADGDPVLVWIEGTVEEFVNTPVPFYFQMSGDIYAREYSGATLSWQDLSPGMTNDLLGAVNNTEFFGAEASAVDAACNARDVDCADIDVAGNMIEGFAASQVSAASGPNGTIVVAWAAEATPTTVPADGRVGLDSEIYVKMWTGTEWVELDNPPLDSEIIGSGASEVIIDLENSARGGGVSNDGAAINEHPSVAVSASGEIFVSYTAVHPKTGQREIVVKKYGYDYSDREQTNLDGPAQPDDLKWVELVSSEVGGFAVDPYQQTGGASNDESNSYDSSIVLDNEGYPIIAWTNASWESSAEIYVKRWNGNDWVELGTGSASDPDGDGNYGVSSNASQSIQPAIAVASNGDVIVTWADWANWERYDASGHAGIFVKVLRTNSSAWEAYAPGSLTGAGIAEDSLLAATADGGAAPGQGWYYSPDISLDSSDNPLITWQGYGEDDRDDGSAYMVNRVHEPADTSESTRGVTDESPIMTVYASYYSGSSFGLLYESSNVRGGAGEAAYPFFNWMPEALVGPNDELIMAYTWHDVYWDNFHNDDEVFVQVWDSTNLLWNPYGRGGNSNGNDVIGGFVEIAVPDAQIGLLNYTTNPNDELDVITAVPDTTVNNGGHVYLYRRDTGVWTSEIDTIGFGTVFDLKGDPSVEFGIAGTAVLGYVDDITGLPYVYQFVAGSWTRVGSGSADDGSHPPTGAADSISVQSGPNGTILLAYLWNDGQDDQVITRLWDPSVGAWGNGGNLGGGQIRLTASLAPVYYANFDGFDWDRYGDLDDGSYDDNGARVYTTGEWYFWDMTDYGTIAGLGDAYAPADLVTGDVSGEAGWPWVNTNVNPAELEEDGVLIEFVIGEDEQVSGFVGTEIIGEVDHQFQLIGDDHVIIELAYSLDVTKSVNTDLALHLVIDNVVVAAIDTAKAVVTASGEKNWIGYSDDSTITIDSDLLVLESTSLAGVTVDATTGRLLAGFHTVGIQAVATVQTIPPSLFTFDADNDADEQAWVSEPLPLELYTAYDWNATAVSGAPGLLMTLGDGTAVAGDVTDLTLSATYTFKGGGDITIDFDYDMDTYVFDAGETLELTVTLDGDTENEGDPAAPLPIIVTGPGSSPAPGHYHYVFRDVDAGDHDLLITAVVSKISDGVLGNSTVGLDNILILKTEVGEEQTLQAKMDNFAVYQRIAATSTPDSTTTYAFAAGFDAGWTYTDVTEPADGVWDANGGDAGAGDGGLVMTLGDGVAGTADMEGRFDYSFTLAADTRVTVDFSYYLSINSSVAEDETLDLIVSLDGVDIAAAGSFRVTGVEAEVAVQSYWQNVSGIDLGPLPAGTYTLQMRGFLTNDDENVLAQGTLKLDDVVLDYYTAYSKWEFIPSGGGAGNTGGNNTVGRDINGNPIYNFQADLHSVLLGVAGTQTYTIDDVVQSATGDMVVSFRYRHDPVSPSGIELFIGGTEYGSDSTGYLPIITYADSVDWYNGNPYDPAYTYVRVTASNVPAGTHDVEIRLTTSAIETASLWIDNLSVLASQPTNSSKPLATLTATGSGLTREFAVGITGETPSMPLYSANGGSVFPVAHILDWSGETNVDDDTYYFSNVYVLKYQPGSGDYQWDRYGDKIASTVSIDFLGIGAGYGMPSGLHLYLLEDLAIGTDQWEWVAMQHFSTDPVDMDEDGVDETCLIHPWNDLDPPSYYTVPYTDLDVYVWRWVSAVNPVDVGSGWEDTGCVASKIFDESDRVDESGHEVFRAYTRPQMVSSSRQAPIVAWTRRGEIGTTADAGAMRYEGTVINADGEAQANTWEILGAAEDVQNNQFWSSLEVEDMTITGNNEPITSYYMGHLGCLGLRQFRTDSTLPSMVVAESIGQDFDNTDGVLDLGETVTTWLDSSINISNNGPSDLIIYDMELGGFGSYDSAFSLLNAPAFPFVLEQNKQRSFTVRFDPAGVPAATYEGSLVIHSNDAANFSRPNPSFYDVAVRAVVLNQGEIDIALGDQWLEFDDQVINTTSSGQDIVIYNRGHGDLTIHEWLFDNLAYSVSSAVVSWIDNDGVEQSRTVSTENGVGSSDNVVLASYYTVEQGNVHNEYLVLNVVFTPTEVINYDQTLYIHSDDSNESIIPVRLSGVGLSGADIQITADGVVVSNTDGEIDFGSVIKGTTSDPVTVVLSNVGSTDLTITEITGTTLYPEITTNPPVISDVVIAAGSFYSFEITYTPNIGQAGDTSVDELEASLTVKSDSEGTGGSSITVSLVGQGVPAGVPMIELVDLDTGEAIDRLDFGTTYINTPVSKTFRVSNIGGMDLTLESYRLAGASAVYTIEPVNAPGDDTDNVVISYGGSPVPVTITFTPVEVGPAVAEQLQVYYLNADGIADFTPGQSTLELVGRATGQALKVTDSEGNPDDGMIDFGNIGQGQTSGTHTVTLQNSGNSTLTVTDWTLAGDSVFSADEFTSSITLSPGSSHIIEVEFSPDSLAFYSATITVTSDDPSPPWTVTLAGDGVAPGVSGVSPLSLDFGTLVLRTNAQRNFTVSNSGSSTLRVTGIDITNDSDSFVIRPVMDPKDENDYLDIDPNESQIFEVVFYAFNPFDSTTLPEDLAIEVYTNDLSGADDVKTNVALIAKTTYSTNTGGASGSKITWTDSNSNAVQIKLTGSGVATIYAASASNNDIGTIELSGTTSKSSLTITGPKVGTSIGRIVGSTLRNITLKNVTLDGDQDDNGIEDYDNAIELDYLAGTLTLGDVVDGADIYIAAASSRGVKIKAGTIGTETDIVVAGNVSNFQADGFAGGSFSAYDVSMFKIGSGDFGATVRLGGNLKTANLASREVSGSFIVDGAITTLNARRAEFTGAINTDSIKSLCFDDMTGAVVSVQGELRTLKVGDDVVDTLILAGFDLGADEQLGGGDDVLVSGGRINSANVGGRVSNSYFIAGLSPNANGDFDIFGANPPLDSLSGSIGKLRFNSVEEDNDDIGFGVAAHSSIQQVQVGSRRINDSDLPYTDEDFNVSLF